MSSIDPKNVCFKPLSPDSKNCATQSIFQYWQNDLETFKKTYSRESCIPDTIHNTTEFSWHDHFVACTINPSSVDDLVTGTTCLGDFGGPAFPFVALGGYSFDEKTNKTEYTKARALIISIQLDNYEDREREEFKTAMRWERDFI